MYEDTAGTFHRPRALSLAAGRFLKLRVQITRLRQWEGQCTMRGYCSASVCEFWNLCAAAPGNGYALPVQMQAPEMASPFHLAGFMEPGVAVQKQEE